MIENVLVRKNLSLKVKITVKSLISAGIIALAVILPQLVHLALGQPGGVVASYVFACAYRRLSFGLGLGRRVRYRFAARQLFDYARLW